ncbi:MAG: short-chain fatty acid transporter [Neisseriaceae bacterium]|nr:short-chain fatty acid transporter [Neisseriaceae bacterium]
MNALTHLMVRLMQRYLPDAFVLAIFLTALIMVLGITWAGQTPLAMAAAWGKGFSSLFNFGMQMALVLITGYVLALTPLVQRLLDRVTDVPKTPRQALMLTAFISFVACYLNWGFGLVVGAILAKEMGRKVAGLHFPLVVAAAYAAEVVRGPSTSIPLVVATPGHFMESLIGIVPVSQTLYASWNIGLTLLILVALVLLFGSLAPPPSGAVGFVAPVERQPEPVRTRAQMTVAERLEHARWVSLLLAVMPILYLGHYFASSGLGLNLNVVIIIFLALALLLHPHSAALLAAVKDAVVATRGILLQFPLYAGVAGMMGDSGMVQAVAQGFIAIATPETFPILTFLAAGLVNMFVPSGGGQWVVQGPIMMEAALALGADVSHTIMAFAWGDGWTNQIQPFWALPLLGVAGLSARDIMGYCMVWLLVSGTIIGVTLLLLAFW